MRLGRVLSRVFGAVHHPAYDGQKLLLVAPLDAEGRPHGTPIVAADTVQAGPGDHVLILQEGNGSAQVLANRRPGEPVAGERPPIRSVVVGIIDTLDRSGDRPGAARKNGK